MSNPKPPFWADKFLEWFCSSDQIEILQGDLHELFAWRVSKKGPVMARLFYIKDVLDMLRPFALKKRRKPHKSNQIDMFKNNLKISYRNLVKQKVNTLINVGGLSIGIAICLLIGIYIRHELNYDKFPPDHDRMYRVISNWGDFVPRSKTAMPVGPALKSDIPLIEESVRYMRVLTNDNSGIPIKYGNSKFAEEGFVSVDKAFLEMFNIELVLGDPKTALDNPDNVIITEEISEKYFGSTNPIGEVLRVEDQFDMIVTGVFKSVNHQTHMYFDFITPLTFMSESKWGSYTFTQNWTTTFGWTYVKLNKQATPDQVEELFPEFVQSRYPSNFGEEYGGFSLLLQPLTDIHLRSGYTHEIRENSEFRLLIQMTIVALVILLVAVINFINLSTARATMRAREVGIRKAMGALRGQLIKQFLTESLMVTTIAFLFAALIVALVLPQFNGLMQRQFAFDMELIKQLIPFGAGLVLILSLLAGFYPAIVLSGFQPIKVLKSNLSMGIKGALLRKIFTSIQFATSLTFLIGIYIIYQQLDYIKTKEVGMETAKLLVINRPPQSVKNEVIVNALEQLPAVEMVTAAAGSMPGYTLATWSYHPDGFPRERKSMYTMWAYDDISATFGFELLAGEDFSKIHDRDSMNAMILNESAVKDLGWTNEEAIGKYFGEFHWRKDTITAGKVVGVIKDFHFESLHEPLKPMVLLYTNNDFGNLVLKLNRFDGVETIEALEQIWNEHLPEMPFSVTFLDDKVQAMYQEEEQLRRSINYFAIIAIFTSALGLLGLVSFVLIQRSKEIGIRKVLGARVSILVQTLSADFVKLIGISFLVAAPLGYYLMHNWLANFQFAIKIGVVPFLFALGVLMIVCLLTVGYKSFRAATVNPADILRDE